MTLSVALELIRVRGHVQGVGFRPAVARLARALGLPGWVKNDAEGVLIALGADSATCEEFVTQLLANLPPLAKVYELIRTVVAPDTLSLPTRFEIVTSSAAGARPPSALVVPDAALCADCRAELLDPRSRRFGYAFTTCTHCGPRFSIARSLPWDRARTTMASFPLCAACRAEYEDVEDRRYHAEPIACPVCGPQLTLMRADGTPYDADPIAGAAAALARGEILALKGLGGYQLLVDATNERAVARLRRRKQRPHKPFALMARDLTAVERYCSVSAQERSALLGSAAPIVLLRAHRMRLASSVAGWPLLAADRYGFMLPTTPLHVLCLRELATPVVCTSGNRSEEPQATTDSDALERLKDIADWLLCHDRPIQQRVDDSVVQVVSGRTRVLRRARGLAPAPLPLPPGFEAVATREAVFAAGTDLKAAICLSRAADLVLGQHLGDLDDALTRIEYEDQSRALRSLFEHRPTRVAVDQHPESRAAEHARALADELGLPIDQVTHHHAHFAACLGENGLARDHDPVLGIVLDGLGVGDDGHALWGGEVFVGGYVQVERVGTLRPRALLGVDRAAREPWRCLYAELRSVFSWDELREQYAHVACVQQLMHKPVAVLEQMLSSGLGAPQASSCGRLFDAVAAALGLCFEQQTYEAQAAATLEALVSPGALAAAVEERELGLGYRLPVRGADGLAIVDPSELWRALLADLATGSAASAIAARFHVALAGAYAELCESVVRERAAHCRPITRVVALSGGCFQNACLYERLHAELEARGFTVLAHARVPSNDGGSALGQALVSLARAARDMEF